MNDLNPYSPPKAAVADVETEPAAPVPEHVETACWLLWVGLIFSAIKFAVGIVEFPGSARAAMLMQIMIAGVIQVGIGGLIVYWATRMLRGRRNWMRWLVTAFTVLWVALDTWIFLTYGLRSTGMRGAGSLIILLEFLQ